MLGQLGWDGAVAPINEITWTNVLDTARRFRGLEVGDDFFVTYKDDEGDVVNVKNEVDLVEAIRWAEEQDVPCLCLNVPFSSGESEPSDSEWIELDEGSPRVDSPHRLSPTRVPSDMQLDMHSKEVEVDDAASMPVEDQVREEDKPSEDSQSLGESDAQQEQENPREPETLQEPETFLEPETSEQPEIPPELGTMQLAEEPESTEPDVQQEAEQPTMEAESPKPFEYVVTTPIEKAFENVPNEFSPLQSTAPPASSHSTSVVSDADIDIVVSILSSVTDSDDDFDYRAPLLNVLSDPAGVAALTSLLQAPAMQRAVVAIAEAEKRVKGSARKATTAELLKVLFRNPETMLLINRVPNAFNVLEAVLHQLKSEELPEEEETPLRQLHKNVCCDGCEGDGELASISRDAGFRNEDGEILGVRYKSAAVPNFDICEACEATGDFAEHAGPFLKIVDPETAPEIILCVLPGVTASMMSQSENLDWRNPLAREFFEFVQHRRQRAFPQNRAAPVAVPAPVQPPNQAVLPPLPVAKPVVSFQVPAVSPPSTPVVVPLPVVPEMPAAKADPPPPQQDRCKHSLKTFETQHQNFTCDMCTKKQPTRSVMHGCRVCNFDVCQACQSTNRFPIEAPPTPVVAPQAKFVSDVTLADGCVVRPAESLTKVWRVRNSGQERWPQGTRIAHVGGDSFGGPADGVEVPLAGPGEAVNITVPLVMPMQPGRYTSYWRMMTPQPMNSKFGHRFWVTVNVVPAAAPVQTSPFAPAFPVPSAPAFTVPSAPSIGFFTQPSAGAVLRGPTDGFVAGSPRVPTREGSMRPPPPPPIPAPAIRMVEEEPLIRPEYESAVAQITDFGFNDIEKIIKVLNEVNGDASRALDRLLDEAVN